MSEVITARYRGKPLAVPVDEITHFKADSKYVVAYHGDGETLLDEPLHALESRFGTRFARIHRSTLVSVRHLKSISRNPEGGWLATVEGVERPLRVSRHRRREVRHALTLKAWSTIDAC